MREVDTSRIWRHVVAGAEMAACEWWNWQPYWPFDNDAVVPIDTYGNAVQLVSEVHVKQFSSAAAPHRLISPARDNDAVRSAAQLLYKHLGATGLV